MTVTANTLGDATGDTFNDIWGGVLRAVANPVVGMVEATTRVINAATSAPAGVQATPAGQPAGGGENAGVDELPSYPNPVAGSAASRGGSGGGGYVEPTDYPGGDTGTGASVWPWLIGLAVLGVGGVVAYRVIKRRKRA